MANAHIQRPDGTKIVIEGSPEEIARVMALYGAANNDEHQNRSEKSEKVARKGSMSESSGAGRVQKGPKMYLLEIKEENFFAQKRSLSDVQKKLEEKGHIYPVDTLSTPILRLVQQKILRRIKDKKIWVYVNY